MKRDPLAVLWRLREAAVTEASRDLAAARAREMQQAEQLDSYRRHIAQEQSEAVGEHVSGFADWLPHARLQRERLQADQQTAESHVRRLQQILVVRRIDSEAVGKAMQRQRSAAALIEATKEQAVMDEAAGRTGRRDLG
jgi:flagellar export protein FliJ